MLNNLISDSDIAQFQQAASDNETKQVKYKSLKYGAETCFQCLQCDNVFKTMPRMYSHWNYHHGEFGKLSRKSENWPKRVREIDLETYERLSKEKEVKLLGTQSNHRKRSREEQQDDLEMPSLEPIPQIPKISEILLCCEFCQDTFSNEDSLDKHLAKEHKSSSDGVLIEALDRNRF